MIGRFFDDTEKAYMKMFANQHVLSFYHPDKIEEYHKLLNDAIDRKEAITVEEIKAYIGEEAYLIELEYLKEWGYDV